jgi:hypothetical protein
VPHLIGLAGRGNSVRLEIVSHGPEQTIAYSNVLIHVAPCKASLTRNFRAQSPIFEIRFWGEDCRYSIAALRDLQYRSCGELQQVGVWQTSWPIKRWPPVTREQEYMPRYYFDLRFGDIAYNDDEGTVLKTPEDAVRQMGQTLLEIGQQALAIAGQHEVGGTVRDDTGLLWRSRLSLQVERLKNPKRHAA